MKAGQKLLLAFLLSSGAEVYANVSLEGYQDAPWLTGPLLAPSGNVTPIGDISVEPYLYITATTGSYNSHWQKESEPTSWSQELQVPIWIGLTEWMDLLVTPTWMWNESQGAFSSEYGDLSIQLDWQLLEEEPDNYLPSVKCTLSETFPTGSYKNLNVAKHGTDIGGAGAYTTALTVTAGRLIHFSGDYWTNLRLATTYSVSSAVFIQGRSAYGDNPDTKGWVYPGQSLDFDLGMEFTLSRNWAFACDIVAAFKQKTRFKGENGPAGGGSSAEISLAPAIEYNWSEGIGLISGAWFTVAGRNTSYFISWVTAFDYNY